MTERSIDAVKRCATWLAAAARDVARTGPKKYEDVFHEDLNKQLDELERRGALGPAKPTGGQQ
jgi:hypothetical protein